jgi:hypothetical protein
MRDRDTTAMRDTDTTSPPVPNFSSKLSGGMSKKGHGKSGAQSSATAGGNAYANALPRHANPLAPPQHTSHLPSHLSSSHTLSSGASGYMPYAHTHSAASGSGAKSGAGRLYQPCQAAGNESDDSWMGIRDSITPWTALPSVVSWCSVCVSKARALRESKECKGGMEAWAQVGDVAGGDVAGGDVAGGDVAGVAPSTRLPPLAPLTASIAQVGGVSVSHTGTSASSSSSMPGGAGRVSAAAAVARGWAERCERQGDWAAMPSVVTWYSKPLARGVCKGVGEEALGGRRGGQAGRVRALPLQLIGYMHYKVVNKTWYASRHRPSQVSLIPAMLAIPGSIKGESASHASRQ